MKDLKLDKLAMLARTCAVHRVFITPYPATDGGGWWLDIDHKDPQVGRKLMTQRGGLRVFKSVDQALAILRECGYLGSVMVLPESDPRPERAAAPATGEEKLDDALAQARETYARLSAIPHDELSAADKAKMEYAQIFSSKMDRESSNFRKTVIRGLQPVPPPVRMFHEPEEDDIIARLEATYARLSAIPRDELSAAQRDELDNAQTGLAKLRPMPGRGTPSGPPKPAETAPRTPPPEVQKYLNEKAAKAAASADDNAKQT